MIYELFILIILKPQILNVFTKLLERVRIQPEGFKYSVLSKKEIEVTEDKTLECVKSLVLVVLFVLLSLSTKSGNFFYILKGNCFTLWGCCRWSGVWWAGAGAWGRPGAPRTACWPPWTGSAAGLDTGEWSLSRAKGVQITFVTHRQDHWKLEAEQNIFCCSQVRGKWAWVGPQNNSRSTLLFCCD